MSTMSSGALEILQPGIGTTVQDQGRVGHRHQGVPQSGWLDAPLARAAHALVGNTGDEALLELRGVGTSLLVQSGPVRVALAGEIHAICQLHDGRNLQLPAWQSITLQTGERLSLGFATSSCAYMAVAGGIDLQAQLGSRSAYGRAGLEGLLGRGLLPGDALPCGAWSANLTECRASTPWVHREGPVRVIAGPQQDHFTAQALQLFEQTVWQATHEQDRMGLRLRGDELTHINPAAADTISDAVTPGVIQVPASGQPMVLLAESQTVGGYPKIATVIRADLPRLAHLKPGSTIRFEVVSLVQARQALLAQQDDWLQWRDHLELFMPAGQLDETILYNNNLVSGIWLAEP